MTELVTAESELRKLIQSGSITLLDLLARLAEDEEPTATQAEPSQPVAVVLSDDDRKALRTLPSQLADLALPEVVRALSEAERERMVPLFDQVKVAKAAVIKAEDALKQAFHSHIDSLTEGPYDKNGHRLTEGEVVAPSYSKKVVRGLTGGSAVDLTYSDLEELEAEGLLSHKQLLAMSKAVVAPRAVVPDAVMAELARDPALLVALASKARKTKVGSAIRMAKN